MMKTWTVDEMLAEKPCGWDSDGYTRERLEGLFDGRDSMSTLDVCDLDIPPEDIVWVGCCALALDDKQRETWLELIITRAVTSHALHCGIPNVEAWARNWLSGKDRTADAARAANDTASAAYAYPAASVAADAAYPAAFAADAAYAASAAFAWATGAAAARDAGVARAAGAAWATRAARAAERKLQVEDLRTALTRLDSL